MSDKMYKRTTVWLPVDIYVQAKITSVLAETTFSEFLRIALKDKIKQVREKKDDKTKS